MSFKENMCSRPVKHVSDSKAWYTAVISLGATEVKDISLHHRDIKHEGYTLGGWCVCVCVCVRISVFLFFFFFQNHWLCLFLEKEHLFLFSPHSSLMKHFFSYRPRPSKLYSLLDEWLSYWSLFPADNALSKHSIATSLSVGSGRRRGQTDNSEQQHKIWPFA